MSLRVGLFWFSFEIFSWFGHIMLFRLRWEATRESTSIITQVTTYHIQQTNVLSFLKFCLPLPIYLALRWRGSSGVIRQNEIFIKHLNFLGLEKLTSASLNFTSDFEKVEVPSCKPFYCVCLNLPRIAATWIVHRSLRSLCMLSVRNVCMCDNVKGHMLPVVPSFWFHLSW